MTTSDLPPDTVRADPPAASERTAVLSASDVREKTFTSTRFKPGYDEDEVDAFLDEVENTITALTEKIATLEAQVKEAGKAGPAPAVVEAPAPVSTPVVAAGTTEMEEMLRRTLLLAQRTADEAVAEAKEQAHRTLSDAQGEATRVLTDARARAEAAEREAASRSSALIADSDAQRRSLESKLQALRSFEQDYRTRLRSYFELQLSELESMASPAVAAPESLEGVLADDAAAGSDPSAPAPAQ